MTASKASFEYDWLLIDANHMLFRVSDRLSDLECPHPDKKGETIGVGGIYGFIHVLSHVVRRYGGIPVVCWEGGDNFRYKLFSQYKAGRGERGVADQLWYDDMIEQQQYLRLILKDLGVIQAWSPGYEADDTIGTLSRILSKEGGCVAMYSGDRDLFQLIVDGKVTMIRPCKEADAVETEKTVFAEHGIRPKQWVDFLALKGDPGDNIQGVRGIGEVKARGLLQRYDTVKAIYAALDTEDTEGLTPALIANLKAGRKDINLWRRLAKIRKDAETVIKPGMYRRKKSMQWFKMFRIRAFLEGDNFSRVSKMHTGSV